MGQAGSNNLLGRGWPLLSLGPEHAATIARDGYSKQQVKEFLFEHARFPFARLGREYQRQQVERWGAVDAPDTMLPIVRVPGDISVIVVGGAGKHSSWQPTFGDSTQPTRRAIVRRDGSPLRRVADLTPPGEREGGVSPLRPREREGGVSPLRPREREGGVSPLRPREREGGVSPLRPGAPR
jgi:hypothetical protein